MPGTKQNTAKKYKKEIYDTKNLRKKLVLMSWKIYVDHLAFVTGAKDLLVVKLLKGWTPKTEVSNLVHHHHQHHHYHLCSLVWQQKHKKIKLFSCPGKFVLWITGARDLLVVELLCCVVLYMLIKLTPCKLSSGTEHELR